VTIREATKLSQRACCAPTDLLLLNVQSDRHRFLSGTVPKQLLNKPPPGRGKAGDENDTGPTTKRPKRE